MYASIILYSIGNIANGFVQTVDQYALVRFITGIGLAGELGAGITLVAELLPKEKEELALPMAGIGLTGAVVAFFLKEEFPWRTCYFIGGGLGFILLLLRVGVLDPACSKAFKRQRFQREFRRFFQNSAAIEKIFKLYSHWFANLVRDRHTHYVFQGVRNKYGIRGTIDPGKAVMFAYAAISVRYLGRVR